MLPVKINLSRYVIVGIRYLTAGILAQNRRIVKSGEKYLAPSFCRGKRLGAKWQIKLDAARLEEAINYYHYQLATFHQTGDFKKVVDGILLETMEGL